VLPAGQTAGGIKEILPVAEIMRRLVSETEAALAGAASRCGEGNVTSTGVVLRM
jgi:hypothetical protein